MELIPIREKPEENLACIDDPSCAETIFMTLEFYQRTGYDPPWICYYAKLNDQLVGSGGFKGKTRNGIIEIAYVTFEHFRKQGIGSMICKELVTLANKANPALKITARTLPEKNYSTRILEKNNFIFTGIVNDPEDGDVWEWEHKS
jgi:[ribosomal protein S5]-alanine N-acetyltransferase